MSRNKETDSLGEKTARKTGKEKERKNSRQRKERKNTEKERDEET